MVQIGNRYVYLIMNVKNLYAQVVCYTKTKSIGAIQTPMLSDQSSTKVEGIP